jgi:transposase
MNATTFGVDIAKNVFQVHWIEPATGEICRRKLARAKVAAFFAKQPPGLVVMEACGGAHHWARELAALGHRVELLSPHEVRKFVSGNKDDAADARAIWLAAQHTDVRRIAPKSAQQQAELSVHRVRSHWMQVRTATINSLRGLLYEFGVVLPKGRRAALRLLAEQRAQIDPQLPGAMVQLLDSQLQALHALDEQLARLEAQIEVTQRNSEVAQRLREVPGIGLLGSTALAATLGDASAWRSAREFAAAVGLTPRHTGTGGKVRMGGISKRGDAYIRTLLIHGARNLVRCAEPSPWIAELLKRRPFNVVATAVAHKLARTAWAMVAQGTAWQAKHRAPVAAAA